MVAKTNLYCAKIHAFSKIIRFFNVHGRIMDSLYSNLIIRTAVILLLFIFPLTLQLSSKLFNCTAEDKIILQSSKEVRSLRNRIYLSEETGIQTRQCNSYLRQCSFLYRKIILRHLTMCTLTRQIRLIFTQTSLLMMEMQSKPSNQQCSFTGQNLCTDDEMYLTMQWPESRHLCKRG